MYDPKTQKFTLIDTCFSTHHLQLRRRCQQQALGSSARRHRQRRCRRLARPQASSTRPATKRQVAGLDADRARHQRQRQARRLSSSPTSRSIRPRTSASSPASTASRLSPLDGTIWGSVLGFPGIGRAAQSRDASLSEVYEVPSPGLFAARHGYRHATASSGCRWRADTWRASTARSAKARSTVRTRPASIAPKAGRSIACPVRNSRAYRSRKPAARSRAITPGWISTTRSAWARTCRSPPATIRIRCMRSSMESSSSCGCPIRWASSPRAWTDASTIRTRGWKGRGMWSTYGNRTPFHIEGGKGTRPKVVKFQLRPDPLAR